MQKILLASLISLSLVACQKAPAPAADAVVTAPGAVEPASPTAAAVPFADTLAQLVSGTHRSTENIARNEARHPAETLAFFGLAANTNLIEIAPGGGWYTEILAPAVKTEGSYTAIMVDPAATTSERAREYNEKANKALADQFAANPDLYGQARMLAIDPKNPVLGDANSADMVVTFRNIHGWTNSDSATPMFSAFFAVLKPGGVLGVEQHRAAAGTDPKETAKKGYVSEEYVIGLATAAGFQLTEQSEINANPKDDRDHPSGVWSLAPNLDVPEAEKAAYSEIGESDRMTLKFTKPAA